METTPSTPLGSWNCYICGKSSPHLHSGEEIARQRAKEREQQRYDPEKEPRFDENHRYDD